MTIPVKHSITDIEMNIILIKSILSSFLQVTPAYPRINHRISITNPTAASKSTINFSVFIFIFIDFSPLLFGLVGFIKLD